MLGKSDNKLRQEVLDELEWDSRVEWPPPSGVDVSVTDGVVTLSGTVSRYAGKKAAQEVAHAVARVLDVANEIGRRYDAEVVVVKIRGVVAVINKLAVKPPEVDSEELRADIEEALERRADREAERLRVEVSDGLVELRGRVHSWQERRAVVGSVRHAPGVSEVKDRLRIDPYFLIARPTRVCALEILNLENR